MQRVLNPADYFSRHPFGKEGNSKEELEEYVNFIVNEATPSAISREIVEGTEVDHQLQNLKSL